MSLTSCGETTPKDDAPYIEMSGSFLVKPKELNSYSDIKTHRDASSLIIEAEAGIPTYVLFAREGCSHCRAFEPYFIGAMKKLMLNINVYYFKDDSVEDRAFVVDNLATFQSKYGTDESKGGISGMVPSLYYLDGKKMNLMDMYDDNKSTAKFTSFMQHETKATETYRFDDYSSFVKALKIDHHVSAILYDSTDPSSQTEYSKYLEENKFVKTFVLDYGSLSVKEKPLALDEFGLTSYRFKIV